MNLREAIINPIWIQWGIIAAYMLFIFGKGVLKARKIHETDDFLVAGRDVRWPLLFATMGATVIGGGYSVGAVGKTYEWGMLMLLVSTGGYLHFIFSGLVVAPKFREAELYTVAGYFGHRFGEGPRFAILVLSLLFSVFIIAAQMAAFGTVLSAILPSFTEAEIDLRWAIVIGGLLVVIYSTAGGLLAVIYTDIYQFVILFAGFVLTLGFAVPDLTARWSEVTTRIPTEFFMLDGGKGAAFLITTFLAFLLGETFAPGYATRYCIGRNVQHTRWGIAGVGFFLALTFPAILFFIALYGRMHFPNIEPQQALPFVLQQLHNPWVAGVMIAALLSAVMSSADSALNSSTAIFVKDLFEHQLRWGHKGDRYLLRLARICSALLGLAAIFIAILWSDIIELLLFTYHVWAPAVIIPVTVGVLTKDRSRAMTRSIFASMLAATAATTVYRFTPMAQTFDPAVFGVGVSVITYFGLRLWYRYFPPK